jgi:hypothetical protein
MQSAQPINTCPMTQPPITVTYTLEEILGQIQQQLTALNSRFDQVDEQFKKIDEQFKKVDEQFKKVDERFVVMQREITEEITDVKLHVVKLEAEVNGIGKRLDTQEFINRSVMVGFILTLVAGIAKLFLPNLSLT